MGKQPLATCKRCPWQAAGSQRQAAPLLHHQAFTTPLLWGRAAHAAASSTTAQWCSMLQSRHNQQCTLLYHQAYSSRNLLGPPTSK